MNKKWEYQELVSRKFCLTLPKTFIVEPFTVSLFSAIKKIWALEGFVMFFRQKVFASQNQIIS